MATLFQRKWFTAILMVFLTGVCLAMLPVFAGTELKAEDLKGEWKKASGEAVLVEVTGTEVAITLGRKRYTGTFAPGSFNVYFKPKSTGEFTNGSIPECVRAQLVASNYRQGASVTVSSKRAMTIVVHLDMETHVKQEKDACGVIKYVQSNVGDRTTTLIREGYKIGHLTVNDNATQERNKRALETRLQQLKQQFDASVQNEERIGTQHDTAQQARDQAQQQVDRKRLELATVPPPPTPPAGWAEGRARDQAELDRLKANVRTQGEEYSRVVREKENAAAAVQQAKNRLAALRQNGRAREADFLAANRAITAAEQREVQAIGNYNQKQDQMAKDHQRLTSLERSLGDNRYQRPRADQQRFDTLSGELERLDAQLKAKMADVDRLDQQFHDARLRSTQLLQEALNVEAELKKPAPSFVQRVEGKVNSQVVYVAEYELAAKELEDLEAQIQRADHTNKELESIRKTALANFVSAETEAIAAGNALAKVQWRSALGRAAVELAADTYDIAKRTGEAGIAGAGIELARKVSERLITNSIEQSIKNGEATLATSGSMELSSDIEKAILAEVKASFDGTAPADATGEAGVDADLHKTGVDAAKTAAKRVFSDTASRLTRDGISQFVPTPGNIQGIAGNNPSLLRNGVTQWIFNKQGAIDAFNKVQGIAGRSPEDIAKQLKKLQQPSSYGLSKLAENGLKDALKFGAKKGIDEIEISYFRDFTIKNFLGRQQYATYRIANQASFDAQTALDELLAKKQEILARGVDMTSGFRQPVSNEFDENDVLEVTLTLKDPAKPPERTVALNTAPARGTRQHYFIRVTKDVAGSSPKNMTLGITR